MTGDIDGTRFLSEIVSEAFLKIMPFFSFYSNYFTPYEKAIEAVKELKTKKPLFLKFLNQCQSKAECRRLDLSSFLIKPSMNCIMYFGIYFYSFLNSLLSIFSLTSSSFPVQRICKYPLFFREILKHTPDVIFFLY